jgi:hypothetical protein
MTQPFPKYNSNRLTAEKGVSLVKTLVENEFGWIFRPTPLEHDFGIDGYIDIVNNDHSITGRSIAVQIKTGISFFNQPTNTGWKYNGEVKHLNYYLNLANPVIIIIVDLSISQAFWVEFDTDKITKTKSGWKIIIDKSQFLGNSFKNILYNLPGFEVDYLPQLEYQWKLDCEIQRSGIVFIAVDKSQVLNLDLSGFTSILKRLTSTDEMIAKCKGKLSFVFFGYEEDSREVYQIDEIREWVKAIIPSFKYWGYFLNMEKKTSTILGLVILQYCSVDIRIIGADPDNIGMQIVPDGEQTISLMNQLFEWLNEFADKYNISDEVVKERSFSITRILIGYPE